MAYASIISYAELNRTRRNDDPTHVTLFLMTAAEYAIALKRAPNNIVEFEDASDTSSIIKDTAGLAEGTARLAEDNSSRIVEGTARLAEDKHCLIGDMFWYENNVAHRANGRPSFIGYHGLRHSINGIMHNSSGPSAIVRYDAKGGMGIIISKYAHAPKGPAIIFDYVLKSAVVQRDKMFEFYLMSELEKVVHIYASQNYVRWNFIRGQMSCVDGPAIEARNGGKIYQVWMFKGQLNREQLPAIIGFDDERLYYRMGVEIPANVVIANDRLHDKMIGRI